MPKTTSYSPYDLPPAVRHELSAMQLLVFQKPRRKKEEIQGNGSAGFWHCRDRHRLFHRAFKRLAISRGAEDPPYRHVPVLHTFGASVGSRPCTVGRSLRNSKEIRMSFLFYLAITSALPLMIFFILMNTHRFGPTTAADSSSCARRACLVRPPFCPSEGHRLIPRLSTHLTRLL